MRTSKAHDDQSEAPPQSAARREAPSAGADVPPPLTADMLRAAQRGAGNAAVAAMIARRARPAADLEQPDQQQDPGVHKVLASTGRPLPAPVRKDMEARFDTDFSDVRLHTGPAAAGSADAIGARAYTSGSHVVLGAGGGDRHTLAHELTHVVQQRSGPVAGTDQGNGLHMSDPSDRFEREAEAHAHRVMSRPAPAHPAGESARRESGGPAGSVQRMVSEEEAAPDPGTSAASTSATAATSATATTSTAAPAPPAPAPGPPQPLQEENAKRVGLEVEITVNLEEPASAAGPSSGPAAASGASRPAKNATVRNGALLAQSGERELGLPVVKLEVEGMDRSGGTPSMEVIYGPLPRAEYASQDFVRARQGLVAQFRTVAGQSVPFSQVITAYNRSLTGGATRYRLTLSTLGRRMTTLRTRAVNENMQTNISVPYAKVGAAPPPPEAASSSAGRGRSGAGRSGRSGRPGRG
uniref:eCIS core domain-containing protein n=1 Tax=Streptomyces acidiscabies TaxID=42234 RepID=UPI00028972B6